MKAMDIKRYLTPSDTDKAVMARLNVRAPSVWLATWFGCGFMRPAPGTWGSIGAIPIAILLVLLGGPKYLAAAIILSIGLGLWACKHFEVMSGEADCKMVVIDEVAGQWISLWPVLVLPVINPVLIAASFLLFRFFDITKPFPVGWLDQNLKGPMGVMADDIAAGLIVALILQGLIYAGFA